MDNLSLEIRNKRITRNKAIRYLVKGIKEPKEDILKFCKFVGISIEEFNNICDKFRDRQIWEKKGNKWFLKNFLIDSWEYS